MSTPLRPPSRARRWPWLLHALFTALLLAGQTAFFLAGRCDGGHRNELRETRFNDQLATAFLLGQTHLPVAPARELSLVPDPYDRQHRALWYWDAVFYQGLYYSYWGPAPALFLAAFKAASGVETVPDRYSLLAFSLLLTLAASAFLALLLRRLPGAPILPAALGAAVLAFGNPLPFMLGHPYVYEIAIVAGQAFLFCGLLFAVLAGEARGRWRTACDLVCAAALTLAVASRLSLAIAVAALWLLTSFTWLRESGRRALPRIAVFATPALLGMLLLGAYNHARFGSPFETGLRYLLSHPQRMGPEYVAPNVYSYLLRPPRPLESFPFVVARWQSRPPFPAFVPVPPDHLFRPPVAGVLYTSPFFVFAAAALFSRWRGWGLRAALILSSLPFVVPLLYFASTMRYLGDIVPGLVVLSVLGLCRLLEALRASRVARGLLLAFATLAAACTAVIGLLLGATSYLGFLPNANPELWQRLERLFSGSGRAAGPPIERALPGASGDRPQGGVR